MRPCLPLLLLLTACGDPDSRDTPGNADTEDGDDLGGACDPAADEVCDAADNDCDGLVDEGDPSIDPALLTTWYVDADHDGLGDDTKPVEACFQGSYAATGGDCDDADPAVGELLDWYRDLDADGYGAGAVVEARACRPDDPRLASSASDCDDRDVDVNPGAPEICNRVDDDCDGLVDDQDPGIAAALLTTFYTDGDHDGAGDPGLPVTACVQGDLALLGDDCDDTDPTLAGPSDWYADADLDGTGAGAVVEAAVCTPVDPLLVASGDDCAPDDASIHPGATEVCADGIDQDCDGYDACHPLLTGVMSSAGTEVFLSGGSALQYAGTSTQIADVDLDGDVELLEASLLGSAAAGTEAILHVWDGPWTDGAYDLGSSAIVISGERADSAFALARQFGDLTGDGLADVVVGDAGFDGNAGRTYVLPGPLAAGGAIASLAVASFDGPPSALSGATLATQDADGDGFLELWVGAPDDNSGWGAVYVVEAPLSGNSLLTAAAGAVAGIAGDDVGPEAMASADFDGDGVPEMAIGAPAADLSRGAVFVFGHTPVGVETAANADLRIDGEGAGDQLGAALALAGDVTGDGLPDLLATAPAGNGFGGAAWLLAGPLGSLAGATLEIDGSRSFGFRAENAGDLDDDGSDELAVSNYRGVVQGMASDLYLLDLAGLAGVVTTADASELEIVDSAAELLGWHSLGGGDLDGDGYDDFPIGASRADANGRDAGGVRILFGSAAP
jgi:hypothetical protein